MSSDNVVSLANFKTMRLSPPLAQPISSIKQHE
jgi:hypothetical protein